MLKFDWNIAFTFVNLIVFYLLMRKFLFGRIKKVMDERKALIQKQFDDAAATEKAADEKLADYESRIANVEAEGEQIITEEISTYCYDEQDKNFLRVKFHYVLYRYVRYVLISLFTSGHVP